MFIKLLPKYALNKKGSMEIINYSNKLCKHVAWIIVFNELQMYHG